MLAAIDARVGLPVVVVEECVCVRISTRAVAGRASDEECGT